METEPGIVFPETSQSNLCGAGLYVCVHVCVSVFSVTVVGGR
jgi:hypothetical protein